MSEPYDAGGTQLVVLLIVRGRRGELLSAILLILKRSRTYVVEGVAGRAINELRFSQKTKNLDRARAYYIRPGVLQLLS